MLGKYEKAPAMSESWFLIMHRYYYAFVMFYLLLENVLFSSLKAALLTWRVVEAAGRQSDGAGSWPGGHLHALGARSR